MTNINEKSGIDRSIRSAVQHQPQYQEMRQVYPPMPLSPRKMNQQGKLSLAKEPVPTINRLR